VPQSSRRSSGFDHALVDGGYRLDTRSFFNDHGPAQVGRVIDPFVVQKEGDRDTPTGIGTTGNNTGEGLQTVRLGSGCFPAC
jgi:hypothetical protein